MPESNKRHWKMPYSCHLCHIISSWPFIGPVMIGHAIFFYPAPFSAIHETALPLFAIV